MKIKVKEYMCTENGNEINNPGNKIELNGKFTINKTLSVFEVIILEPAVKEVMPNLGIEYYSVKEVKYSSMFFSSIISCIKERHPQYLQEVYDFHILY